MKLLYPCLWVLTLGLAGFGTSLTGESISGKVLVDGSSTVFPISEAVGEEFQKLNQKVKVSVASSGTGGGFKKFCKGEIDITGASRPIERPEMDICSKANVKFIELPVAYDGIAIVVNKQNTWAKSLTTAELKKIWESGSTIKNWKDIRPGFPDMKLVLFGPGPDSGTFDYFTKAINQKEKSSRTDFTASESDDVLVKGVAGEKGGLGYFGFAYYEANSSKLNLVSVDAGKGAIAATTNTIASGTYAPLSRPIFIYVAENSLNRPEVKSFAEYYLKNAGELVSQVGYVSLGTSLYNDGLNRLSKKITGTVFDGHMPESSKLNSSRR